MRENAPRRVQSLPNCRAGCCPAIIQRTERAGVRFYTLFIFIL